MSIRNSRIIVVAWLLATQAACSSLPGHAPWGSTTTLAPGWERIGQAAADAALHPGTLYPLAAAAGMQIDNADERLSDWARRETPVFGSTTAAIKASNDGLQATRTLYYVVAIAAPSGDTVGEWSINKSKGLLIDLVAVETNSFVYGEIKDGSNRMRPDGSGNNSFPSGHAGKSSAYANLGMQTTGELGLSGSVEAGLDVTFAVSAIATGWARVEGGKHYPSDVLAGYAVGNFMARFFRAAFMPDSTPVQLAIWPDGAYLEWQTRF